MPIVEGGENVKKLFSFLISMMIGTICIYEIRPELIVSRQIVKSIQDLSLAHGEGYVQEGNTFTNQSDNAFFIYDLGEKTEKYEAINLFFDLPEELNQHKIVVDLYHFSEASGIDRVLVSGTLSAGEKRLQLEDDFGSDRFIRIHVRTPVGRPYTITSIAVESESFNFNILTSLLIIFFALVICMLERKIRLVKRTYGFVKWAWDRGGKVQDSFFSLYERHTEKIGQGRIRREQYLFGICSQFIILFFVIHGGGLRFATNDDTTMLAIASGGYGIPSQYIVNIHILIGYLLKGLFIALPGINWLTVFYLCIYIIAFSCLDAVVIEKSKNVLYFLGNIIILNICFVILIGYFSFTVVAYVSAIAGTTAVIYSFEGKAKTPLYCFWGIVLTILGALCRAEVLMTIILVLSLVSIREVLKKKQFKYLIWEFVMGGIMLLSIKSNFWFLNQNPVEKEFLKWGELRSEALDCAVVPYEEVIFEEAGISREEYNACYNAFYYIKDAVSEEKMHKLVELNKIANKYNFDIVGFIIEHFKYLTSFSSWELIYKWIFAILFILNMIFSKREGKEKIFSIWITIVGVEFLYYFINRPLYRVIMPTYMLGCILCILFLEINKIKLNIFLQYKVNCKKLYTSGCILLILFCIVISAGDKREYEKAAYSPERKKVLDYMRKNNDKLFMAGDPAVFSIGICDSVWNYPGKNCNWNLIGNWEIYSVPSNTLMEQYGYSDYPNIAKEAINNDEILFLTTYSYGFEEGGEWIIDLYERYYQIRPQFKKITDLCTNQINDSAREDWAVYELIYIGE